jgi:hypothetical protein
MRRAELKLGVWAIVVTCHTAHVARVRCKAGIKCLYHTEKWEGPTLVARKCGHELHMSLRSEVRRHRDTKRQSGLPNLLLALSVSTTSAYSNLGVLQGFEPPTSATNSISLPLSHISCTPGRLVTWRRRPVNAIGEHFLEKGVGWFNKWHFLKIANDLPKKFKQLMGGKDGHSSKMDWSVLFLLLRDTWI